MRLAIPLHGKMATRSFHNPRFISILEEKGIEPVFFIASHYFRHCSSESHRYAELKVEDYQVFIQHHPLLNFLSQTRRFAVFTETTDLRFRETIEGYLFHDRPVVYAWGFAAAMDFLRRLPRIGSLAAFLERKFFHTSVHTKAIKDEKIDCVLTPGLGNFGFWNEGFFAREAMSLGIPVFSAITNYDNILNMGYRGFTPKRLAVWSQLMADEAANLQKIPPSRIDVTGPIQYDYYFLRPEIGKDEFLTNRKLDPKRKTIFYAGGVSVTQYFEIIKFLLEKFGWESSNGCNIVFRPWPHPKVLSAPHWSILNQFLSEKQGLFVSNPFAFSNDSVLNSSLKLDLSYMGDDTKEMVGLLHYSDVILNHFSTIGLEAAICDLPTVYIGFDTYTYCQTYNSTSAFQQRQTHNRRKLRLAAGKVATDFSELEQNILTYLEDKTKDHDHRKEYARSECDKLDGNASSRLVNALKVGC